MSGDTQVGSVDTIPPLASTGATSSGIYTAKAGGTSFNAAPVLVNDPNDTGDVDRYGLLLSKNATTPTNSAPFAIIKNVAGKHPTEFGFDIRNGGHCGAGSPRFNLVTNDNVFHFIGGCANGTITPGVPEQGWSRVRFDPANAAQAFPVVTPTETIKSLSVICDEGTDTGTDFSGLSVIDNIDINAFLIGAPAGTS